MNEKVEFDASTHWPNGTTWIGDLEAGRVKDIGKVAKACNLDVQHCSAQQEISI